MSELLKDTELPPIPEDEDEIQKLFCQFIFFETVKRGKRAYLCTRCSGKWTHDRYELKECYGPEDYFWDGIKVNDRLECPKCGCVSIVKNRRQYKPEWKAMGIVYLFPITPDYVVARCVLYEKYGQRAYGAENAVTRTEINRYHFRENMKTVFLRLSDYGEMIQKEHIFEPFMWNQGRWNELYGYKALCMPYNGLDVKRDTFLRYFPDEQFSEEYYCERHYPAMKLTAAYAYHPRQVETLCKIGQFEAVRQLVEGKENVRTINWNALTPWDIHRLPKQVYTYWKEHCYSSLDALKLYQYIGGGGVKGMEQAQDIISRVNGMTYHNGLNDMKLFVTYGRQLDGRADGFLRYIEKLTERYNENACMWGHVTEREVFQTWCDYRDAAAKLGCADKVPVFPHDLKDRHDRLVAEWRRREDERRKQENAAYQKRREEENRRREEEERKRLEAMEAQYKGVKERYAQIAERYTYTDGVYSIVVPTGAADIKQEGYNLFHCTGTTERYFQRIISGESYIVFLRKADKPEESWYTLEVEPGGTIRQKRTVYDMQNDDLDAAIPFLRKWQEHIARGMNGDELRAAMESKRLRLMEFEELRRTDTRVKNGQLKGQRLLDVLSGDLMEALLDQKTGTAEPVQEAKKA